VSILCKVGLHKWKPVVSLKKNGNLLPYWRNAYSGELITDKRFCSRCKCKK